MNPANQTLYDRYRQYILLEQGLSANTRDAYEHDVERFTEWCESEGRDVLTTDLALLHQYTEALYATDAAASSIARMLCGVRSFFRFLQLDGMIEQDPSELLESPRLPRHLPTVLTVENTNRMTISRALTAGHPLPDAYTVPAPPCSPVP